MRRARISIRGAVQGVGFRPFVYRLAEELRLAGWVLNSPQGVFLEVEGEAEVLERFLLRLERERPRHASIQSLECTFLDPVPHAGFEIRESLDTGEALALVLPDIATCPDCLRELFEPADRRYRYPFSNCTNCGPRFSIIEALPYDRAHTSMRSFALCAACREEYENPRDRRFHAQPTACAECGPHLELQDRTGRSLAVRDAAVGDAVTAIRSGKIVAVKGLGGFHLVTNALDPDAVARLRERKHREEKPFAVMFPDLAAVREECEVSALEDRLLLSPEAPIVLLRRKLREGPFESAAPGNPYLGVLLPYTPLHHLLLHDLGTPVIATSGNLSDEPICIDEHEARHRLGTIADVFLVHNRPIVRHVDDSIVRVLMGRELVLRRARGYAPLPVRVPAAPAPVLAVGAHLKNTIALHVGENAFLSQHIGDLENQPSRAAFEEVILGLQRVYEAAPARMAADLHPDYLSTQYARASGLPVTSVQHHHAHVAACMVENELEGEVLGVAWDGVGWGPDGTVWGGEFLTATRAAFERSAFFRPFALPGGSRAIKEPRRSALGVLHEILGDAVFDRSDLAPLQAFSAPERDVLRQMLAKGLNSPPTSSAGRLFDAVASITGLRQVCTFEGQAAMELEFAVDESTTEHFSFRILDAATEDGRPCIVDWEPLFRELGAEVAAGAPPAVVATRFHVTLAEIIVEVARRVARERVVLTGGCFQNRYLTECAVRRLEAAGFRPYWHQRVPPGDGGIALGQIVVAAYASPGS